MQNHSKVGPLACCFGDNRRRRKAFSLVELLAVIGIIGILLALLFPAAQAVRRSARKAACLSNLRQVMMATIAYEGNGGGFPTADNGKGGSFVLPLLNYMDENKIHAQAQSTLGIGETHQDRWSDLSNNQMDVLLCPATGPSEGSAELVLQGKFTTHYFGVAGPAGYSVDDFGDTFQYDELMPQPAAGSIGLQGLFSPHSNGKFRSRRYKDITDGASNTLAYGEIGGTPQRSSKKSRDRNGWSFGAAYSSSGKVVEIYGCKTITKGINEPPTEINDIPFRSSHPGGAQFAFVDGSTSFVEDSISLDVLKILGSIDAGEANNSALW